MSVHVQVPKKIRFKINGIYCPAAMTVIRNGKTLFEFILLLLSLSYSTIPAFT
jgi:hypothetical protein